MSQASRVTDEALREMRSVLRERLERLADPNQFAAHLDPLIREVLREAFARARADEGTIWLVDPPGEFLVPAYNTGPRGAEFVGVFKQPLQTGLISMVFATEQPFLENEVPANARRSELLDSLLHWQTSALIAVPFHLFNACRGVVSCVRLLAEGAKAPDGRGFRADDLVRVQHAAVLASRLLENRLLHDVILPDCR